MIYRKFLQLISTLRVSGSRRELSATDISCQSGRCSGVTDSLWLAPAWQTDATRNPWFRSCLGYRRRGVSRNERLATS